MENITEIMKNEEAIETNTEKLAKATTGKGLRIAAEIGIGILVGYVICEGILKPISVKIKKKINDKKAAKAELDDGCEESDYYDEDDSKETD